MAASESSHPEDRTLLTQESIAPLPDFKTALTTVYAVWLEYKTQIKGTLTWRLLNEVGCFVNCVPRFIDGNQAQQRVTIPFTIGFRKETLEVKAVLEQRDKRQGADHKAARKVETAPFLITSGQRPPAAEVLLIGISKYSEPPRGTTKWPNLCFPALDTEALGTYFTAAKNVLYSRGYEGREELLASLKNMRLKKLVNERATRGGILQAIDAAVKGATYRDTVIVFFSGHGYHSGTQGDPLYLIPYESVSDTILNPANITFDQVSREIVQPAIQQGELGSFVMIVDTCFSGAALKTRIQRDDMAVLASAHWLEEAKDGLDGCKIDPALPRTDVGRGVFVGFLLETLESRSDKQDEKTGIEVVSLSDVHYWLTKRFKGHQHPALSESVSGPLVLPIVPATSGRR